MKHLYINNFEEHVEVINRQLSLESPSKWKSKQRVSIIFCVILSQLQLRTFTEHSVTKLELVI